MLDERFFASLFLNLDMIRDDSQETMATNGKSILWGGDFTEKLDPKEVKTVLCHETLHCALTHFARIGARNPNKWNRATDYEINNLMSQTNDIAKGQGRPCPFTFPKGALINRAWDSKSAEEIYSLLPDEKGDSNDDGKDSGGMGRVIPKPNPNGKEAKAAKEKWEKALVNAVATCKNKGELPGSLRRLVEEILNPPRNWRDALKDFVKARARDNYSFRRPNRRYLGTGFFLPTLFSEKLGKIAIAVDTSGSIGPEILNAFISEIEGIAFECKPESIIVLDCDAHIHSRREFFDGEPLPRQFAGGGGTDFRPVFKELESDEITCLIYFTDTYGSFPENEPAYPTIWATLGDGCKLPFGQQIKIQD